MLWLLLIAGFFQGSGKAAADKRGEPQEVGCAPLLRFSPFEIPFPYLPRVRFTWVGFIKFLLSVQRAENRYGEQIRDFPSQPSDLLHQKDFC